MTQNARGMPPLPIHTVRTPPRQFTLSREPAHPLLVAGHRWNVRVTNAARGTGPEVTLTALPRRNG